MITERNPIQDMAYGMDEDTFIQLIRHLVRYDGTSYGRVFDSNDHLRDYDRQLPAHNVYHSGISLDHTCEQESSVHLSPDVEEELDDALGRPSVSRGRPAEFQQTFFFGPTGKRLHPTCVRTSDHDEAFYIRAALLARRVLYEHPVSHAAGHCVMNEYGGSGKFPIGPCDLGDDCVMKDYEE